MWGSDVQRFVVWSNLQVPERAFPRPQTGASLHSFPYHTLLKQWKSYFNTSCVVLIKQKIDLYERF